MGDKAPYWERPFDSFPDAAMVDVWQNNLTGLYYAVIHRKRPEFNRDYVTCHANAAEVLRICAAKIREDESHYSDYEKHFLLQEAWALREHNPPPVQMSTAPKIVKATEYGDWLGIEAADVLTLVHWSAQYKQAREHLGKLREGERGYAHRRKALRAVQRDATRHCEAMGLDSISYHLPTEVLKDGKAIVINLKDWGYEKD